MKKIVLQGIAILSINSMAAVEDELPVDTTLSLQEVTVRANFLSTRETPLNITNITPAEIRLHSAAPNYLEMMQGVPGIYATSSTGNYGDATLNMRGFKQDNIAILLNGIPIQGLTSGSMYWSNWMGLADATYSVQVQKGMGGSMLADCAMGGLVNIITKRNEGSRLVEFGMSSTSWGTTKSTLSYSSGLLKNGWCVDAVASYVDGRGFIECSDIRTFSYMLSISKLLNENNTLIFTALGSPEQHDQRNTELTENEINTYGRGYSKNWGYLNGKKYSIARNHYYKPYFTLQHLLDGDDFSMKNSLYLAIADGGGRSTYTSKGSSIISHRTTDGLIDFNAVEQENSSLDANGKKIGNHTMIDYLSGHTQAGAIMSADYKLSDAWKLSGGLQYQYYDTWSKMEILDLLGADYFMLYGQKYYLGDKIGSAYGRTTHHGSGFAQIQYATDCFNWNFGVSVFNGNYRRHNDLTDEKSDWAHGWGESVKMGALYHINANNAIYFNAGYNSRLPYANTFLASSNLSITNDIVNEKNIMLELGWRPQWNGGGMELSGYLASWRDKTLSVSLTSRASEQKENYLVKGLNALHLGAELSAHQRITPWLTANAYAMVASWKWKSSGTATIYDKYTNDVLSTFTAYCDGLHVGDAPQTQFGIDMKAKWGRGFYANIGWNHNARMYADFEPSKRIDANDSADSYLLPSYDLFDASVGYETYLWDDIHISIFANCTNLFDATYIERGIDGKTHDIDSFAGYWGGPRTIAIGFKIGL